MNRSEIRHALYRAKNGIFADDKKHIYDIVKPKIPVNESWATFSKNWDIFYINGEITVIQPETDYDFIHTTCLEKSLHIKNNINMDATHRQLNAIQIVELNMLDGKMTWPTYNKTWGIWVDRELKRVHTKLFMTSVNTVTDDMIKASAPSDGAAMTTTPEIPMIVVDKTEPISADDAEKYINAHTKKKRK